METEVTKDGIEDAAILLMALGEEEAAAVFRHLSPKEVQRLGEAMTRMQLIPRERVAEVLAGFSQLTASRESLVPDTEGWVRGVMQRALGAESSRHVIERMGPPPPVPGIEAVRWMDARTVAEHLAEEHPQVIAALLAQLDPEQAGGVLGIFDEALRRDVLLRVATLADLRPAALEDLQQLLARLQHAAPPQTRRELGGPRKVAALLNQLGGKVDEPLMEALREVDEALAQQVADQMFVFDNLMEVDDRGIQTLLKEVQSDALVVALKGATPELREKFLRNMSSRAAETLREDLEARGPVRVSEVEAQQREILKTARRMADDGQLNLGGSGGEAFV